MSNIDNQLFNSSTSMPKILKRDTYTFTVPDGSSTPTGAYPVIHKTKLLDVDNYCFIYIIYSGTNWPEPDGSGGYTYTGDNFYFTSLGFPINNIPTYTSTTSIGSYLYSRVVIRPYTTKDGAYLEYTSENTGDTSSTFVGTSITIEYIIIEM